MSERQELQVREKQELQQAGETTREGAHFTPSVDIYEVENALMMVADVPGAKSDTIELDLQDSLLTLTAQVSSVESRWKPIYTEYEIGHYTREFRLGQLVDKERISAQMKDGVLTLTLPKVEKAQPRRINVQVEG